MGKVIPIKQYIDDENQGDLFEDKFAGHPVRTGEVIPVVDRIEPTKERSDKLTRDMKKILNLLHNGQCWLIPDLAKAIGNKNHSSVSSNVRNLRKKDHGGHKIKLVRLGNGLNGYVLQRENVDENK